MSVEQKILNVEPRTEMGSSSMRRLRNAGTLPAVVYTEGKPASTLKLNAQEFTLTVRGCKPSQIFKFKSSNPAFDGKMALVKAVQVEAVKGRAMHIDFLEISAGHAVTVSVPVELVGECAAIKESRALLNQSAYEIEIECLPDAIPSSVKLDISALKEGGSLHASDAQLPAGVKLRSVAGFTIVSAISKKAIEAQEAAMLAKQQAAAQTAQAAAPAAAKGAEKKDAKSDKK